MWKGTPDLGGAACLTKLRAEPPKEHHIVEINQPIWGTERFEKKDTKYPAFREKG